MLKAEYRHAQPILSSYSLIPMVKESLNSFDLNLLIGSYRFQLYISMINDLYCVPTTQGQIIFCHHICGPLCPFLLPQPLPSGNHHTAVYVYVSVLYPTYEWNPVVPSVFWLFHLAYYSQGPLMLSQRAVFYLFCWLSSTHCIYESLSSPPLENTLIVSMP